METSLPAVITVQKGINEVRYPSLRLIMKAKRMPIETLTLNDLGLDADQVASQLTIESYKIPEARQGGILLTGEVPEMVSRLLQHLQNKYKII